ISKRVKSWRRFISVKVIPESLTKSCKKASTLIRITNR
ncbi:tetratricopeptide repeat family protein, partial [Vibrio parahaemolyticus V-223/04]